MTGARVRPAIAATFWLLSSAAFAGPDMGCERWEYARLKDSTKQELVGAYCSARQRAKLNEDLSLINKDLARRQAELGNLQGADDARRNMAADMDAQIQCVEASGDAWRMLNKKYRLKVDPKCE